jgi:hypothetical protein
MANLQWIVWFYTPDRERSACNRNNGTEDWDTARFRHEQHRIGNCWRQFYGRSWLPDPGGGSYLHARDALDARSHCNSLRFAVDVSLFAFAVGIERVTGGASWRAVSKTRGWNTQKDERLKYYVSIGTTNYLDRRTLVSNASGRGTRAEDRAKSFDCARRLASRMRKREVG